MTILLAPSETKQTGGDKGACSLSALLHGDTLLSERSEIIACYDRIIKKGGRNQLSEMFGLKKDQDIDRYRNLDITAAPTLKAIERYTGVAFDHLGYAELADDAQKYVDDHVILFSNLFGVLRADDLIPDYRLQQGKSIGDIRPEVFYKKLLKEAMDEYLENEEILDIRAGFYDKFYKPAQPHTTLKFTKEGKVVSHWAKAYRGIVLREIAKVGVTTLDAFMRLPIEGLSILEIQSSKNRTEIIYEIAT